MRIGYACKTLGIENTIIKSCMKKNASAQKLTALTVQNLTALANIIEYNINNDIFLFRISSDIIPFGSSPVNMLDWSGQFKEALDAIGSEIIQGGIRVSMHPGQYTVLNSPSADIVESAINDLAYHAAFLDSLGVGSKHKIVLHIGGAYGDKKASSKRFVSHYSYLPQNIKNRLVLENDDTCYTIGDVLHIGAKLSLPVVYDNLHNALNVYDRSKSDSYWIAQCKKTWSIHDGNQKIHYSQQHPQKKPGSHSDTIRIRAFLKFYEQLENIKPDIMLEVKDKNLSAVKCINCVAENQKITALESEWSRYKYAVLERSPQIYEATRQLLKNKERYPAEEFYTFLEDAFNILPKNENSFNAALHVWGYLKEKADEKEKKAVFNAIQKSKETFSYQRIKNILFKLAQKYNESYLLKSYYFYL